MEKVKYIINGKVVGEGEPLEYPVGKDLSEFEEEIKKSLREMTQEYVGTPTTEEEMEKLQKALSTYLEKYLVVPLDFEIDIS